MASELDVLLDKVDDPALRADLKRQVELFRAKRRFGLVFEEHLPERVRLPEHAIRRGTRVVPRDEDDDEPRPVVKVAKNKVTVRSPDGSTATVPADELVVVADFGEPIYPGLRRLGSLNAGGDKPAHVVIKGENHHVLEALQFTHAGKIDCIYIDPPYNTGARDWKYGNDYVDKDDAYRHSKWLAFMERRLKLAKALLNPDESVLIATIDEKEYLRLGLLLERVFSGARIQMVSITNNPKGTGRPNDFSRVDEYAFYVLIGAAVVQNAPPTGQSQEVRWRYLRRNDLESVRGSRPRQFYPVYVDPDGPRIVRIGAPLAPADPLDSAPVVANAVPVFPIREDGLEMEWGLTGPSLAAALEDGFVRVTKGKHESQPFIFSYLTAPNIKKIVTGELVVTGRRPDGSKVVVLPTGRASRPTTVWREKAHDAGAYGKSLLSAFVPGRSFPFPKSLYAVEDTLRYVVKNKPDAIILDFFAGSGTTTHAVLRLNNQDGGQRQSIAVTNNEVSEAEARTLRRQGHRPGEEEWEALGIFEHITRPRITAAITGVTSEGEPVKGEYRFVDEFPMSDGLGENVEFFELTYLDPEDVEISAAFAGIAPLLWLRAGGRGEMIEHDAPYYAVMETYGVLFNPDRWRRFVSDLHDGVTTVFIVTDSPSTFAAIASELPTGVEAVRLYENYLSTFTLNTRRTVPAEDGAG